MGKIHVLPRPKTPGHTHAIELYLYSSTASVAHLPEFWSTLRRRVAADLQPVNRYTSESLQYHYDLTFHSAWLRIGDHLPSFLKMCLVGDSASRSEVSLINIHQYIYTDLLDAKTARHDESLRITFCISDFTPLCLSLCLSVSPTPTVLSRNYSVAGSMHLRAPSVRQSASDESFWLANQSARALPGRSHERTIFKRSKPYTDEKRAPKIS